MVANRNKRPRDFTTAAAVLAAAFPTVAAAHGETLIFTLSQFAAIPVVAILALIVPVPWPTRGTAIMLAIIACFVVSFMFTGSGRLEWQFAAGLVPPIVTAMAYIGWSVRSSRAKRPQNPDAR